jgi:hypothetical protein
LPSPFSILNDLSNLSLSDSNITVYGKLFP